jgi:hypothetical protein
MHHSRSNLIAMRAVVIAVMFSTVLPVAAQNNAFGIIPPWRMSTEWQRAGVPGGIPNVTVRCRIKGAEVPDIVPWGIQHGRPPVSVDTFQNAGATKAGNTVTLRTTTSSSFTPGDRIVVVNVLDMTGLSLPGITGRYKIGAVDANARTITFDTGNSINSGATGGGGRVGLDGDADNINALIAACGNSAYEEPARYLKLTGDGEFFLSDGVRWNGVNGVVLRGSGSNGAPHPTTIYTVGAGFSFGDTSSAFVFQGKTNSWEYTAANRVCGYGDYGSPYGFCGQSAAAVLAFRGGPNNTSVDRIDNRSSELIGDANFLAGANAIVIDNAGGLQIGSALILDEDNEEIVLKYRQLTSCSSSQRSGEWYASCKFDNSDGAYTLQTRITTGGVNDGSSNCSFRGRTTACYIPGYFVTSVIPIAVTGSSIDFPIPKSEAAGVSGHIIIDDGSFHFLDAIDIGRPQVGPNDSISNTPSRCSNPQANGVGECSRKMTGRAPGFGRSHFNVFRVADICDSHQKCKSQGKKPGSAPFTVFFADNALVASDYHANRRPGVWWPEIFAGKNALENVALDNTSFSGRSVFLWYGQYGSWLQDVSNVSSGIRNHGWMREFNAHITVQDNYFYGYKHHGAGQYGIELYGFTESPLLVQNIFDSLVSGVMSGVSTNGVISYNYFNNSIAPNGAQLDGIYTGHDVGTYLNLYEGNFVPKIVSDHFHGSTGRNTYFRNWLMGCKSDGESSTAPVAAVCTPNDKNPAVANFGSTINLYTRSRENNVLFNILGASPAESRSPFYRYLRSSAGDVCSDNGNTSLLLLGYAGSNCQIGGGAVGAESGVGIDPQVSRTLYSWGNFTWCVSSERCSSRQQFFPEELPPLIAGYLRENAELPKMPTASLAFAARPSWFASSYAQVAWPPISPEGKRSMGPDQRVGPIPAFLAFSRGSVVNGILRFDAVVAYGQPGQRQR